MKRIIGILVLAVMATSFVSKSESKEKSGIETVTILTSAVCGECKERIENELNYTKGVIFAELDVDTKEVTVKYKSKVISHDAIIKVINNLGYDADDSKRNEEAFAKLPKCCQSAGHCSRD